MSISVTPVKGAGDLRAFIRMVWSIYRDDPYWVPPVIADRRKLLDRERNPFFRHAEMELFLARRGSEVVGRIAAIVNHNHNREHADRVGFFGFFETIDDQEVANALLDAAERWLAERGMDRMRGPVNPSMNDEAGLLVEGFDDPPVILTTYNPVYYSRVIEAFGLRKIKDLLAWRLSAEGFLSPKLERVQRLVREREKLTVRTMKFSPKEAFRRDVDAIKRLYNEAWMPNWGHVRMTEEEFDFAVGDLKQVADERLIILVERHGEVAGFALGLPDINQALMYNRNGGLIGAGIALLLHRRKINRGRVFILGVKPAFQRLGIDAVLYYEVGTAMVRTLGYAGGEASWILDDNVMMNRALEMMNGEVYKRYRIYEKSMNKN